MRTRRKLLCYMVVVNTTALVFVYLWWIALGSETTRYESTHDESFLKMTVKNHAFVPPNDRLGQQELTMRIKLDQIKEKCQNYSDVPYWKTMTPIGEVWNYKKKNLYYCIVPKVGCTYWKRIIRFMSHDFPKSAKIRTPSDISRYFVHYGTHPNIAAYNMKDEGHRKTMANNVFMFTRNPFARLWSAYIDKFFLPDFWEKGTKQNMFASENPTEKEIACNDNLTFKGFLTAIARNGRKPDGLNEHFTPIHQLCSPCHVKFAAIGKMENFTEDSEYILSKFGISVNHNASSSDMGYEEIKTLTRYNFAIETVISKNCFNKMLVAQRLWKAFQYNGYLNRLTPFPSKEFENSNFELNPKKTFVDIVTSAVRNQTASFKSQKRSMMLEAYEEIPKEVLNKIKRLYKYDFELFGYEPDLFA